MTNNKEFYNSEIKERFLNTIDNPLVRIFTTYPLKKAKETEEILNKDIYDMTLNELEDVVRSFVCTSLQAVQNYVSKLEEYIEWAIDNGYRKSNISPFYRMDKLEWSRKLVATSRNYYFTREEIIELMKQLVNETDKAVLLALFEGIKGKAFSEILNLEAKDITEKDGNHWVKLKEDGGKERTIKISKLLADTLYAADEQERYVSRNGESIGDARYDETPFEEGSPYIFKKSNRGKQGGGLTYTFINRKFILFKEVFGLEHIKSKHISDSGIMHMANEIQEEETIKTTDLIEIADHFDTTYTQTEGNRYRNTTVVKRIIEMDKFENLYGYKMKFQVEKQYN